MSEKTAAGRRETVCPTLSVCPSCHVLVTCMSTNLSVLEKRTTVFCIVSSSSSSSSLLSELPTSASWGQSGRLSTKDALSVQAGGHQEYAGAAEPLPRGSSVTALRLWGEAPRLSKGPGSFTSHETPIHPTLNAPKPFQGMDGGEGDGGDSQPHSSRTPWTPPLPQLSLTAKVSTDEVVDFRRARPRPRPPWDPPRGRLRPGKLLLRPCGQGERGVTAPGGPVGPPRQGSRGALPPPHPTTRSALTYLLQGQPREGM